MPSEVSPPSWSAPKSGQRDRWLSLAVLVAAVPLLFPLLSPDWFPAVSEHGPRLGWPGVILAGLLPVLAAWLTWRWWPAAASSERGSACLAFGLLSLWCVDLHYSNVDLGHYFAPDLYRDNVDWQRQMQDRTLRLDPNILPHSYRFLPNCVAAWLEALTGNYLLAALIYRLTSQWLLLLSIYRLARVWGDHRQAMLSLLLYALAFVPSLRYYAGQLTDPLSHLSFVLGCLFLATNRPWPFFAAIVLGVLAKESVLALAAFPLAWWIRSPREALRWCPAFLAGLALALLVRWRVVGQAEYENISGVTPGFVLSNLGDVSHWVRQTWETVGALWVVALFRWNAQPLLLRRLTWHLFFCLWGSSLCFSHLKEARNLIPVSVLLAIQAARAMLSSRETDGPGDAGPR